jgi:uncharacterized DUF497 family protein
VRFEWDEAENEINRTKHGISFRTAARVFSDPNSFQYPWRIVDGEERWQAIGCVEGSLFLLTVMHTGTESDSGHVVRIISARPASTLERDSTMKEFSVDELRKPLSEDRRRELLALMDKPDSEIDFSDIPAIRELPAGAVRGLFYRGPIIRLNENTRRYFADLARRRHVPMNGLVNEALEKALAVVEVAK